MLILTIRTDKPKSEIGLYEDDAQLRYEVWEAHRRLAETINAKIANVLQSADKTINDIQGIIVYKGPGSFTGLRIGLSVANTIAYSLGIPIVAKTDDWIEAGIKDLAAGKTDKIAVPEYGAPVHITTQKK